MTNVRIGDWDLTVERSRDGVKKWKQERSKLKGQGKENQLLEEQELCALPMKLGKKTELSACSPSFSISKYV